MLKLTFSASNVRRLRLRRAATGASVASTLLVACWSIGVGARQAAPKVLKASQAKSAVPSPTSGKTGVSTPPPASADIPKRGHLTLNDFEAANEEGIAIGHKFVYTTSDGETVISGENGRYEKKNDIMDTDTNLVLDNPKHHITGDKSHVELGKSRLVVNGNVVLTLKPEKAANTDPNASVDDAKKQGAVVTCDEIESFYKKKFNILRGHLVFKQHILRPGKEPLNRVGTAEHAEYDGKKEILTLFPPVHFEDSDNQKFDSAKSPVTISTKSGKETVKGLFSTFEIPVKETDEDDNTPPNSAPANPANPTAPVKLEVKPDETKPTDTKKPDDAKPGTGKPEPGKPSTSQ